VIILRQISKNRKIGKLSFCLSKFRMRVAMREMIGAMISLRHAENRVYVLLLLRTGAAVSAGLDCEESKKAYEQLSKYV
jgi:hypothetical protein